MRKLLNANFARLKHSKAFWAGELFMVLFSVTMCMTYESMKTHDTAVTLDSMMCKGFIMIGIVVAVFSSMFIGTEYSDGTIRNKLVVGLNRNKVYFSNYIVCTVAGFIMMLSNIMVNCVVGIPLFGGFTEKSKIILPYLGAGMVMILAFSGIFTTMAMLIQNKATSSVLCTLLVFSLLIYASYLISGLNQPEFYETINVMEDGKAVVERILNPTYLSGKERDAYQFIVDFLPTGQAFQISAMEGEYLWRFPVLSGIIVVVTNLAGILIFRKKDLK